MTRRDNIRNEHIRGKTRVVQASTKITDFVAGSTLVKKSLVDTAVPSVFRWTQEPSPAGASRVKRAVERNDRRCRLFEALPDAHDKQDGNILVMSEVDFHLNMEAVVELAEGIVDWWGSSDRVSIPVICPRSVKSQIPH